MSATAATLAKQEGCSYAEAARILYETGHDPVRARAIIRSRLTTNAVVSCSSITITMASPPSASASQVTITEPFPPPFDPEQARQAIEAADAEFETWGPHKDMPEAVPMFRPIVIGSVWRSTGLDRCEVVVTATGEVIAYHHPSFNGAIHVSQWHDNYEPVP